ncbi:hypothetical protein Q3G72_031718 [Acer saccharum]|nr:hypothetical protein Q3G72_009993 [Acer saccharum]KAK1569014.1 hypothetical protein Q3G72_031718 [Acer saccharum]
MAMGRLREAVLQCEEALKLDYGYGRAHQRTTECHESWQWRRWRSYGRPGSGQTGHGNFDGEQRVLLLDWPTSLV